MAMDNNVSTTKSNMLTEKKHEKNGELQPEISQRPTQKLQLKTKSTRRRSESSYLHEERKNLPALKKPLTYSAVRSLCNTTNSQLEGRGEGKGERKERKNFGRQKHRREGKMGGGEKVDGMG